MRKRYVVLGALCLLGVILYIDRICISLALPAIEKDLDIEPEDIGWISLAFSIAYALFEIPSGHLGDRFGARGALARITVWWSVFTALTGAAFGFTSLVVTRFLFGAGEAGAWPNTSTVVSKWFPAKSRGAAMGLFGAATTIGGGLSPLIVIPLQHAYGWRASFFVFAAFGCVWAAVWWLWFRDAPSEMNVSAEELAELPVIPLLAKRGIRWSVALRQPSIWGLVAMAFANIYCAFFGVFWMPTYLKNAHGFDDTALKWTSVTWIASMLGNACGGLVTDLLVRRVGRKLARKLVGSGGMLIVASGVIVVTQVDGIAPVIVTLSVVGAAWGLIQANSFAACIDIGGDHVGTVAGTMNTFGQLGGGVSVIVFGYLVKATGGYDVSMFAMAAMSTLGATTWLWIDASRPLVALEVE